MAFIKKLVMHGFKSFARKTEVLFDNGINVVLGPNGSGKSNISDALCFALGRLSIKSMRAAKTKNLIFMGSKVFKPAKEAFVEIIFDNTDRSFNLDKDEISLQRIVRINGQGIYKLNGETKTRTEILELLAHAGIDPYGFNIILQGQIDSIIRVQPEERRKIIEEVAGIGIYESRKEKSLKELEKTQERIKEINTVLRERSAYLKNLENEKSQAEKHKNLQLSIKKCTASILNKKIQTKEKELKNTEEAIEQKQKFKESLSEKIEKLKNKNYELNSKIENINKYIQKTTGLEQNSIRNEIVNLKSELEGLKVRKENFESKRESTISRINELEKSIPSVEEEIKELKRESPIIARKAEEIRLKKEQLAEIEKKKRSILILKNEVSSLKDKILDKEKQRAKTESESEQIVKQIEYYEKQTLYKDEKHCKEAITNLREHLSKKQKLLFEINEKIKSFENSVAINNSEINRFEKIKSNIEKLDICPLCQSIIDDNHKNHVISDSSLGIDKSKSEISKISQELNNLNLDGKNTNKEIEELKQKISSAEIEFERHKLIKDKKNQLTSVLDLKKDLELEIKSLNSKLNSLEDKSFDIGSIDEKYSQIIREIEEISSSTDKDVDTKLLYFTRDLEEYKGIIKISRENIKELDEKITEIKSNLDLRFKKLKEKEEKEDDLNKKFKKMFEERDSLQKESQEISIDANEKSSELRQIEEQINFLRIGKAKFDAEFESLSTDFIEYKDIEIIQGSLESLQERLEKSKISLASIGSINMRALEVYEEVKKEYDSVYEKVQTLENEKIEIMKIVEEIDKKKKKTFMRTFIAINEKFTNNFSKLSMKGTAYLELENKENIFEGGINIIVKFAKGKYFDVTSLSGGEKTLVALSLLFAVQEYKPYHFYIFDEIDAALDKRNSERLAALLKQYMKAGQYIVVTHNDAIILESNILYGVSMHEGISKILSLRVSENKEN
jgi:chromosome segregation protein